MAKKRRAEFFIQFWDEAPAIGSGWRGVAVHKLGHKWAHIISTGDQTPFKMSRKVWDKLPKHVVKRGKLTGEVLF